MDKWDFELEVVIDIRFGVIHGKNRIVGRDKWPFGTTFLFFNITFNIIEQIN